MTHTYAKLEQVVGTDVHALSTQLRSSAQMIELSLSKLTSPPAAEKSACKPLIND